MPIVTANGIDIAYDEVGDKSTPAIVLIMGLGTQMISWPEDFCAGLADRGFRVIRFDNRDIGLSTKIETAPPVDLATAIGRAMAGKPINPPYTLNDMAADTISLMDVLGIKRAHIVGASMGGMIAQIIAAQHQDRTRSLTSIMSSSGDPKLPPATAEAMAALLDLRPPIEDRESAIQHGSEGLSCHRVVPDSPHRTLIFAPKSSIASFQSRWMPSAHGVVHQVVARGDRGEDPVDARRPSPPSGTVS